MRLPKLDAIYFLTPTVQNVQSLIDDFKDGDKFMYRRAHVYFTSSTFLSKLLISLIACHSLQKKSVHAQPIKYFKIPVPDFIIR
jgi:hypothetical protein